MGETVRRLFFFAQIGLLIVLIVLIALDRSFTEMMVVSALALIFGVAGMINKTLFVTRQSLTLTIDGSSPGDVMLGVKADVSNNGLKSGDAIVAQPADPLQARHPVRPRRTTVSLRRKPDTEMILAIDDALENAAPVAEQRADGGGHV